MAAGPWRCSECGTINEPVANSCRTCGRWPSLFDLEASVVDETEVDDFRQSGFDSAPAEPDPYRAKTVEPEAFEPEQYRTNTFEPEPVEPMGDTSVEAEPELEPEDTRRSWFRFIVPVAVLVYFAISFFVNNR